MSSRQLPPLREDDAGGGRLCAHRRSAAEGVWTYVDVAERLARAQNAVTGGVAAERLSAAALDGAFTEWCFLHSTAFMHSWLSLQPLAMGKRMSTQGQVVSGTAGSPAKLIQLRRNPSSFR